MPKMKSHSGAKKRFKVTATGKVKINSTDRGHFLTEKRPSRKRKLRKGSYLTGKMAQNVKRLIQG